MRRSIVVVFGVALVACADDDADPVRPDASVYDTGIVDASEAGDALVPKGDRVLGIGLDLGDPAYFQNLQLARDAGASATNVDLAWDEIERASDAGPDAAPTNLFNPTFHVLDLVLPEVKTSLVLAAPAIDVGGTRLPIDLAGKAIDDPATLPRYALLEDYVLGALPDVDVPVLLVATGVDQALGDDAAKWAAFASFVTGAAAHAKPLRKDLAVGFGVSADAFVAKKALMAGAVLAADVIALTYIPIDAAAKVRPTTTVAADLAAIATAAAGKRVILREVGYPSSATCGSDDKAESAFVDAIFKGWDANAKALPFVAFAILDDSPDVIVTAKAARAGRSDAPFLAMLGSLGLRTTTAVPKPSFSVFLGNAKARGF